MDVVEVRYDPDEEALHAAGAVTAEKQRLSPAVISKVVPGDTEVHARSKRRSHNVAKSVLLGAAPNTVHLPTDENDLHRFKLDLEDRSERTAGSATGSRSAVAQEDHGRVAGQLVDGFGLRPALDRCCVECQAYQVPGCSEMPRWRHASVPPWFSTTQVPSDVHISGWDCLGEWNALYGAKSERGVL